MALQMCSLSQSGDGSYNVWRIPSDDEGTLTDGPQLDLFFTYFVELIEDDAANRNAFKLTPLQEMNLGASEFVCCMTRRSVVVEQW